MLHAMVDQKKKKKKKKKYVWWRLQMRWVTITRHERNITNTAGLFVLEQRYQEITGT